MTSPLLRFVFELYLDGAWVDITTSVRHQRVNIERGTRDESPKVTPAKAKLKLDNADDRFNPRNPTGPWYGLLRRNTPIRISCAGAVSDAYRFYGEVFAFQPRWNEDRSDCWVDIEANGALRRLLANDKVPISYYRSWVNSLNSFAPQVRHYWPLEEAADAGAGLPDIGETDATLVNPPVSGKAWGAARMNDWIPNGVLIDNLNTLVFPCDQHVGSSAWEMSGFITHTANETVTLIEVDCDTHRWFIYLSTVAPEYTSSRCMILHNDVADISPFTVPPLKDAGPVWFCFRVWFNVELATLTARWSWAPVGQASNSISVDISSNTGGTFRPYPREIKVSSVANTADNTSNISATGLKDFTVATTTSTASTGMSQYYVASKGAPGEASNTRFTRICTDQGINNSSTATGAVLMGRQYVEKLETHLQEIVDSSGHSAIVESRTANELRLLGTGTYRGAIDYSELVGTIEPNEDDRNTANIVRLENSHAGQAILRKPTGVMSEADIGPFAAQVDTNSRSFSDALSVAGKRLALGTWEGPRFVEITVSARSTPAAYALYRSIDVGDFFGLTGFSPAGYNDTMIMKVTSLREAISHEDHRFTFTARPGELDYRLWTVGTSRLDVHDVTVSSDGGSTVTVNVPTAALSTTAEPYDIMIAGERMTVTSAAAPSAGTQVLTVTRSVNGVVKTVSSGDAVHIYPAFFLKAV